MTDNENIQFHSKKDIIEKVKNLTKTIKSDITFESTVLSFIKETFGASEEKSLIQKM